MSDPYPGFPRSGEFRTLIVDPPWPYSQRFKSGSHLPYETMTEDEIFNLPVGEAAASDAILLCWHTNAHAALAIECVRNWGFTQKTTVTWGKLTKDGRPRVGTGHWFPGATEHAIFATRGNVRSFRSRRLTGDEALTGKRAYSTLILTRGRTPHSRKPPIAYAMMEQGGYAPRLELFARGAARPGWAIWGAEAKAARLASLEEFTGGAGRAVA